MIFITTSPEYLTKSPGMMEILQNKIESIPWNAIGNIKMGEFPLRFSFGGKIFGARINPTDFNYHIFFLD